MPQCWLHSHQNILACAQVFLSFKLADVIQDDDETVAPRARAPRRTAVAAKKKYIEIDEEDSDVISIEDSDESDFEA